MDDKEHLCFLREDMEDMEEVIFFKMSTEHL